MRQLSVSAGHAAPGLPNERYATPTSRRDWRKAGGAANTPARGAPAGLTAFAFRWKIQMIIN
jgi:hypothetical protein